MVSIPTGAGLRVVVPVDGHRAATNHRGVAKKGVNPDVANLSNAVFPKARLADVGFPAGMTKVFSSVETAAAARVRA